MSGNIQAMPFFFIQYIVYSPLLFIVSLLCTYGDVSLKILTSVLMCVRKFILLHYGEICFFKWHDLLSKRGTELKSSWLDSLFKIWLIDEIPDFLWGRDSCSGYILLYVMSSYSYILIYLYRFSLSVDNTKIL